jgi:hypothetical protein
MSAVSGVKRAVDRFDGSPTKMAAALGGDVLRQHVEHWLKVGRVPPEHAPAVTAKTSVPLWELRPDDWYKIWPYLIGAAGAPAIPMDDAMRSPSAPTDRAQAAHRMRSARNPDRSNTHRER